MLGWQSQEEKKGFFSFWGCLISIWKRERCRLRYWARKIYLKIGVVVPSFSGLNSTFQLILLFFFPGVLQKASFIYCASSCCCFTSDETDRGMSRKVKIVPQVTQFIWRMLRHFLRYFINAVLFFLGQPVFYFSPRNPNRGKGKYSVASVYNCCCNNTFPINRDIQILRRAQLRERDFLNTEWWARLNP